LSTPNDIAELLRRGIEAAREGRSTEARGLFEQVVELDEKNEKGWFWLASVVTTDDERRICLSNVLHINPNNERAKRALDALNAKAKETKTAVAEEEVVAGVSRRQMTLVVGFGAVVVILVLVIALVVVIGNNNRIAADRAATEAALLATQDAQATAAALAVEQTSTAVSVGATETALYTPVVPTRSIPTLPPTWTPTPEATLAATREALPMPSGVTGRLAMWGGNDELAVGYLPVGYYDFDIGSQYQRISSELGSDVSFAANGQRVIFTGYDILMFDTTIIAVNLNGTQEESIPTRWQGQTILSPEQPRYGGPFTQYVVFLAFTDARATTQVFLLDLNAAAGTNPVRQLTDDDLVYTQPVLSPDGTKVIAVRSDPNSVNQAIDLVNIDVATGGKIPVTNDGASFVESSPYFTEDGSQVIYSAAPSNQPGNADIYLTTSDGNGSPLPIYRGDGNDIYPVLSPDKRFLAFASNINGQYDIFVVNQNTGELAQLTNTPENEYPGDWWQPS
jgi:Tol biopolymer transport system component